MTQNLEQPTAQSKSERGPYSRRWHLPASGILSLLSHVTHVSCLRLRSLFPFYRKENWGSGSISDLAKVTQPVRNRSRSLDLCDPRAWSPSGSSRGKPLNTCFIGQVLIEDLRVEAVWGWGLCLSFHHSFPQHLLSPMYRALCQEIQCWMDGQGPCLYRTHNPVGKTDDMWGNRQHIFRVVSARKEMQQGSGIKRMESGGQGPGDGRKEHTGFGGAF